MTGGRVAILGETGRNFGAGMSGGIAYVWNKTGDFERKCNMGTFELESMSSDIDIAELKTMIRNHQKHTDSSVAGYILDNWEEELEHFVKVIPTDYKRVLTALADQEKVRAAGAG